jgi:hypothetical protein
MSAEFTTLEPMLRGDYAAYDLELTLGGVEETLAGKTVRFTAKQSIKDELPFFQKTIGDGITVLDEEAGTALLEIDGADTASLEKSATLVCDCEVKDVSGRASTTLFKLPVKQDVTTN